MWEPPERLKHFLAAQPPPICVNFGSMVSRDVQRVYDTVLTALAKTNQRGVIVTGWGGWTPADTHDNILTLAEAAIFIVMDEGQDMTAESLPLPEQIAQALGETESEPIGQIERLVRVLGDEAARALLLETLEVEASGGMMLGDGSRRRTPGGVLFKLARGKLTKQQQLTVFGPQWKQRKRSPSAGGEPAQAAIPAVTWTDRGALIEQAAAQPGRITTVKVTLIGRPGKIVEQKDFTLLRMTHSGALPSLPKGIPAPQQAPQTLYVVYVGAKQWRGVAEAIKNPEDSLIIEGTQIYDAQFKAISVFAMNVTTKALQQAKRQAKQEK